MRKNNSIRLLLVLFFLFLKNVMAQQTVVFSPYNLKDGVIEKGAGSMNTCWLMDSDIERPRGVSNEERFVEIGVGSLRFPYGHLADNYLWDTPPYGSDPLVPKVASNTTIPGYLSSPDATKWGWATNSDGTLKKDLDFDEFMAVCQRQNIKPLVVVNAQAHKYKNGVTYQELKTTAVEWVKYAKLKGYKVAYWQIGNEIDHHPDVISANEYHTLYVDFVTAMKQADPTISCGPGILSSTAMLRSLLNTNADLVDFTSTHQYLFADPYTNYDEFVNYNGADVNKNIINTQNSINSSNKPDLPILITETNVIGNWENNIANANDLYKGLAWFDMLFTQQENKNVEFQYMWNSHSPWQGEFGAGGPSNGLANNISNSITATGLPVKILNDTSEERIMIPDDKVHGATYSYGTYTPQTGHMTLYLINKSTALETMNVDINGYDLNANYERYVFTGDSPYDTEPTYSKSGTISMTEKGFTTSLPPHSLVVVKLTGTISEVVYLIEHAGNKIKLKSDVVAMDVVPATASDLEEHLKWELIEVDDDYVYIQDTAHGLRLQGVSATTSDESAVRVAKEFFSDDSVKWKLTKIGEYWFIDNKAHNTRLNMNGNNEISVGDTSWDGQWVQWRLIAVGKTLSLNSLRDVNFNMYPNPVKQGTNMNIDYMPTADESSLKINITNLWGALAFSEKINLFNGENTYEIGTGKLSSGFYLVNLITNKGLNMTKKILINK